jgi:hypothetical protein
VMAPAIVDGDGESCFVFSSFFNYSLLFCFFTDIHGLGRLPYDR